VRNVFMSRLRVQRGGRHRGLGPAAAVAAQACGGKPPGASAARGTASRARPASLVLPFWISRALAAMARGHRRRLGMSPKTGQRGPLHVTNRTRGACRNHLLKKVTVITDRIDVI